jgi:protein transport protein SEC24
MSIPVAKNINAYFKSTDVEALSQFILKRELSKVHLKGAKTTRESVINNLVALLYNYRTHCATTSSPSQLILPDSLKLLPLYILSTMKTPALKLLSNTKIDDKIYWISKILSMPLGSAPFFFYPRIYKITDIAENVTHFALIFNFLDIIWIC